MVFSLTYIIKANKRNKPQTDQLAKYIWLYFENTNDALINRSNQTPMVCLKNKIDGKKGIFRQNILGKRCDNSARTVISPDPTIKIGEVSIPLAIAMGFHVKERVNRFNKERCEKFLREGKIHYVLLEDDTKTLPSFSKPVLKQGDIILRDGKKNEVLCTSEEIREGDRLFHTNRRYLQRNTDF